MKELPMLSLPSLALRYLIWLVGLRFIYGVLVQLTGLPDLTSVGVILSAVPLVDVAQKAAKQVARPLYLFEMAKLWGICLAIFIVLQVLIPAVVLASRAGIVAEPGILPTLMLIVFSTGVMMAVFLWIGSQIKR